MRPKEPECRPGGTTAIQCAGGISLKHQPALVADEFKFPAINLWLQSYLRAST